MLNPAEFAYHRLGLHSIYEWQADSLLAIGRREKVALLCANESGKTAVVVAASVLWFLYTFPTGRCVVTSGIFRQVADQLWRALEAYRDLFPHWTWNHVNIKTPEGGFALGFRAVSGGSAEGWHAGNIDYIPGYDDAIDEGDWQQALDLIADYDESSPLFIVADEMKSVSDDISQAIDRCNPQYRLYCSSPGAPFGQLYRCFNKEKRFFWTRRVTSEDCPHLPKEIREEDIARYGAKHPYVLSKHFAQFFEDEEGLVMTPQAYELAVAAQPAPNTEGELVAFIDFAKGRDENVIAIRKGAAVWIQEAWHDADSMRASRKTIGILRECGLKPGSVWGDADGLGGPICDRLAELGFPVNRFHGGTPAKKKEQYANLISEVWYEAAARIEAGEVTFVNGTEEDDILAEQVTTRPSDWDSRGKLAVLPKSQPRAGAQGTDGQAKRTMKALGLPSPDRADAVLGAIMVGKHMVGAIDTDDLKHSRTNTPFSTPVTRF